MSTIRALAEHNRTIVTVIHQPSSEVFELFDKLCLLSGGRSARRCARGTGLMCISQTVLHARGWGGLAALSRRLPTSRL